MPHYFFCLMNVRVDLLQAILFFFIDMLVVLKHTQFHSCLNTFQSIVNC